MLLRGQPHVLRHLTDEDRRHLATLAKPLGWRVAAEHLGHLVAPGTLRGWFRRFVTATPKQIKRQHPGGRTPTSAKAVAQIIRMARQNPWGYRRIVGTLNSMGIPVSAATVRRVLKAHGIKPAPDRRKASGRWRHFLAAHWSAFASIDFTSVPVLTLAGWKPTMIGVVMHLASRRVHVAVVTQHPDQVIMQQVARSLTMADTGFLAQHGITHLIHDGGGEFCKTGFDDVLQSAGITIVRTPPRAPNRNPHIERFFRSLKTECLDRTWFVGDRGLRHTCQVYAHFHNHQRPHQGIGNVMVDPDERLANSGNRIERHRALGGILNFYCRSAA